MQYDFRNYEMFAFNIAKTSGEWCLGYKTDIRVYLLKYLIIISIRILQQAEDFQMMDTIFNNIQVVIRSIVLKCTSFF